MIGVIADDLTGAAELGAIGLRHGLRAEVVIAGGPGREADIVCLDTDSRLCDATEAAGRAAAAVRSLQAAGAKWIYKKTDSVLRGNVTAEITAIIRELRLDGALLIPANPSLGRTIVGGKYFIRGNPIHETDFARDPKHPRNSPNVLDLVEQSPDFPVLVAGENVSLPMRGIVIGEVATSADVQRWASLPADAFLKAGGAEFFGALLQAQTDAGSTQSKTSSPQFISSQGLLSRPSATLSSIQNGGKGRGEEVSRLVGAGSGAQVAHPLAADKRELFVCGSASAATKSFIEVQKQRGVPVISLPEKLAARGLIEPKEIADLAARVTQSLHAGRVVLHVGLPPVEDALLAEGLAQYLVQVAERVLNHTRVSHVYAEGGATAVALARRMGWGRLKLVDELAPGVATLTPDGQSPTLLTIKPGSYSWPETILKPCAS